MWITFKSCIFAFWNNSNYWITQPAQVVNYIQILYLCILKQPNIAPFPTLEGCELHSNLVSLHSETTISGSIKRADKLWITFKSCIFAFWNNGISILRLSIDVVNYIQILYLCILKQLLDLWFQVKQVVNYIQILYLCILKQLALRWEIYTRVVNYIQILYLCILKQLGHTSEKRRTSCELHSILVSLHSETTLT